MVSFPFSISVPMRLGIIDVGSNSTHLLVADVDTSGTVRKVAHEREQLRLAEMLDGNGNLGPDAVSRLGSVLKDMRVSAEKLKAPLRAVGTFAVRDARNWPEFCDRVRRRSGVDVEVASGREEARLIHLGVTRSLDCSERAVLVLDIGGGSAELVVGRGSEILMADSLKLGAVRLAKKFLRHDPFLESELEELRDYVNDRLIPVCAQVRRAGFDVAMASGGTAKSLRALGVALRGEPPGGNPEAGEFRVEHFSQVFETLSKTRSEKERRALPGMDPRRADVIVAGALVFDAVTHLTGVRSWTVATSGVREGILIDTVSREILWKSGSPDDVRWRSVRAFAARLGLDEAHGWHVAQLAMNLFEGLASLHGLGCEWREYLRAASFLHEIGIFLDFSAYHKHSAYLIRNSSLAGFTLREREVVAAITRFHRKRTPEGGEDELRALGNDERVAVGRLSALLRLAVNLEHARRGPVERVESISCREGRCVLSLVRCAEPGAQAHPLQVEPGPFEAAFGVALEISETWA